MSLLGKKVRDTVTGLRGTVIAEITYMNGCVQYQIQPKAVKDGVPAKATWFDKEQVELWPKPKKHGIGGPPPSNPPKRSTRCI
jgi:hypothetical protein